MFCYLSCVRLTKVGKSNRNVEKFAGKNVGPKREMS